MKFGSRWWGRISNRVTRDMLASRPPHRFDSQNSRGPGFFGRYFFFLGFLVSFLGLLSFAISAILPCHGL
jgi:hypothetical protein